MNIYHVEVQIVEYFVKRSNIWLFSGTPNPRMMPASTIHNHPPVVHQMFSPNGNAYQYTPSSGSKMQQMNTSPNSGGIQPLYANAPPKPRRLNTSRDQSPSPERMVGSTPEETGGFISPPMNAPPYGGQIGGQPHLNPDPMMVHGRYHHPLTDVHQVEYQPTLPHCVLKLILYGHFNPK